VIACQRYSGYLWPLRFIIKELLMEESRELTQEELLRYHRQIIIPDIGEEGQKRISEARVFVAGIGGLGSISSYYLAAAGIGYLRIADRDKVEYSNLNRQIIHWTDDIGEYKSSSGLRKLKSLNPHCSIEALQVEIAEHNCLEIIGDCSIIVDAMDNMQTRRILNAAAVKKRIPYVFGGVHQLDGMASTFIPGKTPCLECIFPDDRSEQASTPPGILGPVPGMIACIQAIEAIKLILGMDGLLAGRLLSFCAGDMTFREFKVNRDPDCAVCRGIE
jgi:molybdopterin/thiamine biosynthesis adenylyltransferase